MLLPPSPPPPPPARRPPPPRQPAHSLKPPNLSKMERLPIPGPPSKGLRMKLARLASALLVFAAPLLMAQTSTWKSDPAHSEVDFNILHMGVSHIHGRFGAVDATVVWNEQDPTKSTVNATIDVSGVDTGVPNRD